MLLEVLIPINPFMIVLKTVILAKAHTWSVNANMHLTCYSSRTWLADTTNLLATHEHVKHIINPRKTIYSTVKETKR